MKVRVLKHNMILELHDDVECCYEAAWTRCYCDNHPLFDQIEREFERRPCFELNGNKFERSSQPIIRLIFRCEECKNIIYEPKEIKRAIDFNFDFYNANRFYLLEPDGIALLVERIDDQTSD